MAQLTVNQCQVCGKILAPGVTECGKCHTKHSIQPATVNPLRFTAAEAAEYRAEFQEQVAACPKDSNAQFAMGLTYLGLKNYELADEYMMKAVQLTPSNPDVYYYAALSMFHHRSVMNLSKAEMNRIEEWLNTAVQIQPKRKFLILQMILRQGMSSMGINVDTDKLSPAELMKQARVTAQEEDELQEIEQHVLITDEKTQILLDKLKGNEEPSEGGSRLLEQAIGSYSNFCDMPRVTDYECETDNIIRLADEEVRQDFFRNLYYPPEPNIEPKPGYLKPLWRSIWKCLVAAFVWVILVAIVGTCDWVDGFPAHVETVQERMEQVNTKKMTKKEVAEARERAQAAYEKEAAADSTRTRLCYMYKDEAKKVHFRSRNISEEEILAQPDMEYLGMAKGWRGWMGIILILLPIVVWIITTIARFSSTAAERKKISDANDERINLFNQAMDAYNTRPSVEEFKAFCSLFAGPNDTSIIDKGDFVKEALRQAKISEKDIQNGNGKVFFSCYFMDTDSNGNDSTNPGDTLRELVVRVCVAMRDSIVYMHGVWDTAYDQFPILDQERLLYSQIANFRNVASYSTLEVISHSNSVLAKIIYAFGDYPSLFQYQSLDPDDTLTYNATRTSDFDEFYNSLVKMHTAYVKS